MLINNFQRILIKFCSWLATGILICLVGISGVFADTYNATQFTVEGYDNYGPSLSKVTTDFTNNSWRWTIPTMSANTSGTAFIFNSPIPLISNHTYILTSQITNSWGACIGLSTYNRIGLGTSISNSKSSYENNTNVNEIYSNRSTCDTIQFAFTPTINGTWLTIPFNTTSTANNITFTIYNIVIDDLGSKSLTQNEINNSLTNQTNTLNNSITNSTNSIVNNSNSNKNEIIENQNETTENIINQGTASTYDSARNDFDTTDKNCGFLYRYSTKKGIDFYSNGTMRTAPNSFGTEDYISLQGATKLVLTDFGSTSTGNIIIYDSNKNYIDFWGVRDNTITLPSNSAYFRYGTTIPTGHIFKDKGCTSKLDELNDSINNDDTGSANNDTASFITGFNTNTFGLTSIITAPLNLIQSLTSKTCTSLHLPLPYLDNKYLDLPCMSTIYSQHFGSFFTLYQTITYGIIAYWVCVRIFNHVKDFKNPEHDEIEVVDL